MPTFDDLICDNAFEPHQAIAGRRVVTCDEAMEAWYGARRIVPNRRRRRGPFLMLGRTLAGRDVTVVLLPSADAGTWVAYTAWDTKPTDR